MSDDNDDIEPFETIVSTYEFWVSDDAGQELLTQGDMRKVWLSAFRLALIEASAHVAEYARERQDECNRRNRPLKAAFPMIRWSVN